MMRKRPFRAGPRAGFTVLEVTLAAMLTASMMIIMGVSARMAMQTYFGTKAERQLAIDLHKTLSFLSAELASARHESIDPKPALPWGADALTFLRSMGYDGEQTSWGGDTHIGFELEASELSDGLDNNGNGLVDEGTIVWVEAPGEEEERRVVRVHGVRALLEGELANGEDDNGNGLVDERGLAFLANGDVLTIWLSLERIDPEGRRVLRTGTAKVQLQN